MRCDAGELSATGVDAVQRTANDMPKYHFDLVRNGETLDDTLGVDLIDDEAAMRVAAEVASEFRGEEEHERAVDGPRWWVEIVEGSGRVVARIPI